MINEERQRLTRIRELLARWHYDVYDIYLTDSQIRVFAGGVVTHKMWLMLFDPQDKLVESKWLNNYSEAKFEFELGRPG